MGKGRSRILGVGIDKLTREEATERCLEFIAEGSPHQVVTPNAEIVYAAQADRELMAILAAADLVVADGAGVTLASRLLGDPVPEKVAGVDLVHLLLSRAPADTRVYLLGAAPDSVRAAAIRVTELYPQVTVAGYRDGYWQHFDPEEDQKIVAAVCAARPHILLCGMGAPKQEKWLARYLPQLGVPVCMGIGGGIDLWAGKARRAPAWMIRTNLEWLYRVVRFGRYGRSLPPLAKFAWLVLRKRARLARE